jgi:hypothetical protein
MRKRQLKAKVEDLLAANTLLHAKYRELMAKNVWLESVSADGKRYGPDDMPMIVETVLGVLIAQFDALVPPSQNFHVYVNGKDVTKAEIDRALKFQVETTAAAFRP